MIIQSEQSDCCVMSEANVDPEPSSELAFLRVARHPESAAIPVRSQLPNVIPIVVDRLQHVFDSDGRNGRPLSLP